MREALEAVKRALGAEAVILGTRTVPATGLAAITGQHMVEITAAPAGAARPARRAVRPERAGAAAATSAAAADVGGASTERSPVEGAQKPRWAVPQHMYPYYVQLVQNEVADEIAQRVVSQVAKALPAGVSPTREAVHGALREYIARMIPETSGVMLESGACRRVAFVGPPGSGKTTALAKIAAHFKLRAGRSVALLSLDMNRVGGHEQLRHYADVIDVPVYRAQTIGEVKACLKEIGDTELLLIDSMGVGLREHGRFARLATLLRAARPDETHLVLPASLTPEVQGRVVSGFKPLGVQRVFLTHLDEVVGLGIILNMVMRLDIKVSYLSHGQNVPNDLEEACGSRVAEVLLCADEQ